MKKFMEEFKAFAMRGNVLDMAIGVVIGGAFGKITTSLVNDIIMPVISKFAGGLDFSNWFIALDGGKYTTLAAARQAGAATLNYGMFLTVVLNFQLMALVMFILMKSLNKVLSISSKHFFFFFFV